MRASDLRKEPEDGQIDPFEESEVGLLPTSQVEDDEYMNDVDDQYMNQNRAAFFGRERRLLERDSDEGEDLFGENMER